MAEKTTHTGTLSRIFVAKASVSKNEKDPFLETIEMSGKGSRTSHLFPPNHFSLKKR